MNHRSFASRLVATTTAALFVVSAMPVAAVASPQQAQKQRPPAATPPPVAVKVNRTVPTVKPPSLQPEFSAVPTDEEFFRARVFEEPLVPLGGSTTAAENKALAATLSGYLRAGNSEKLTAVEAFLEAHPSSPWRIALLTNLGIAYRHTGYFSRALAAWERAWALAKGETDARGMALGDRALGELAELNGRLGRYEALEALFAETKDRDVRGSATEKLSGARHGLWLMRNKPQDAFRCGPMALDRILAYGRPGYQRSNKISESRSSLKGMSLAQVQSLSGDLGMQMQMARRRSDVDVPVPSVVHWKAGHFAALVRAESDRYLIQDPTFGEELWVSRAALNDEASGYFLVPAGPLAAGWSAVGTDEGATVWGKGNTIGGNPQNQKPPDPKVGGNQGGGSCPMATYAIHSMLVSLNITDLPVSYFPPVGPAVGFRVTYNQRDAFQPQIFPYSNMGPKWTFDWLSYITDNPANPSQSVTLYVRGGGEETYTGYDGGTQSYAPHVESRAVVVRTSSSPIRYERRMPDGSVEVFAQPDGAQVSPRKVLMTQSIDPQGNALILTYDASLRIVAVTDAIDQVTTVSYELGSDPLKITKVTDPFGRFASFEYNASGRLFRITDTIGIVSQFNYGASDFIAALTTPYGTTAFTMGQSGTDRWIDAINPLGGHERVEYRNHTAAIADAEPTAQVPTGVLTNRYLGYRNSFFWDARAMALHPGDYTKARVFHWLHTIDMNSTAGTLESEKMPLENRVWYSYPGQARPYDVGTGTQPLTVARVLDDGTSQIYQYEYNARGMKTREIDPLGRETVRVYGTNNVPDPDPATGTGLDLLNVKVKNNASPGAWDVTATYTYNTQAQPCVNPIPSPWKEMHLQCSSTDSAGQVTTYTYGSQGRMETVTTPPRAGIAEERTTTYGYDSATGAVATVTAPGGVDASYTYDDYGRLRTTTDNDGYILIYDYDSIDRQTKVTYPDGTYEETVYQTLDPIRQRDRLGRWTHTFYDALRRVASTRDPENRVVSQEWCSCGSLDKLIDPNGNATTWERDIQNRVTREVRANASAKDFTYETTTSRLKEVKDAKLQEIHYTYALDDKLLQTTYVNAEHPTPNVSFSYTDPATSAPDAHGRLRQVVDGTGTTIYAHQPITGSPSPGAGRLASVDGPVADDTISYGYDEMGRVVSRTLNGVNSTWSYDQEGRLQTVGDPIGNFTYAYVGNSGRVQSLTYPNNQTTSYAYYPMAQDLRLQEIHHKKPSLITLNKFNYTYDALGNILTWTQQTDQDPAKAYDFGYDRADQLTLANLRTTDPTPSILKRYRYAYDPAGNRTAEQIDDAVKGASHDNMNRLMSQQAGGALLFRGTVNEPAMVTVAGIQASVTAQNLFSGTTSVPSGTSQVIIQATDSSGNLQTNTYEVTQSGSATAFAYDANGNMTSDGVKTFEWDAEDRLIIVKQAGSTLASFTYDAIGRRAIKAAGGLTTSFVFDGAHFLEARPTAGATTRYIYGRRIDQALAQSVSGAVSYFAADHLGSIVRNTDATGTSILLRDYDPWGSPLQGSTTSGYAFTGRDWDAESEIYYYRARYYDPKIARFMSEDPSGTVDGPNLYAYVHDNPINLVDPTGLFCQKICIAFRTHLKPKQKKIGPTLASYCEMIAACVPLTDGCKYKQETKLTIKVWVPFANQDCPELCGFIWTQSRFFPDIPITACLVT